MKGLIKTTADVKAMWLRWFFHGATGSGKTHAAGTFPSPLFIVPANESSFYTLLGREESYDYIEVSNRVEMTQAVGYLETQHATMQRLLRKGKEAEAYEAFPYETIVVESLSHYCELLVEDISRGGQQGMDQQAWGKLSSHLRGLHARLSKLDAHIVYTALSVDPDDKNKVGKPMMTGKNATLVPAACDVIAYFEEIPGSKKSPPIHRAHFRRTGNYIARSRIRGFPARVDDFHFDKLVKYFPNL